MPRRHFSQIGHRASDRPPHWGDEEPDPLGYPRPQLRRSEWFTLNGVWDFDLDADAEWRVPDEVGWQATIVVPFAPETTASGIENTGLYRAVWYRRRFHAPELSQDHRLILHFGAVDYH